MGAQHSRPRTDPSTRENRRTGRSIFSIFLFLGTVLVFLTTEVGRRGARQLNLVDDKAPTEPLHTETATSTPVRQPRSASTATRITLGLLPIALLVGVSALFLKTSGLGMLTPTENEGQALSFEKTFLQPGRFILQVSNSTHTPITITTANINDTILPFIAKPSATVPPMGTTTLYVLFPWVRGEAYSINLLTADSSIFTTDVSSAETTADSTGQNSLDFVLIGLAIGLFPVLCGITWFPAVTRAGRGLYLFLLALVGGLLAYLSLAIANEALAMTPQVSSVFQGMTLVIVGALATFLGLRLISAAQTSGGQAEAKPHETRAWILTAVIGAQNLAESLAIGAAFSAGAVTLGLLFIISLIFQNVTQGLKLIASTDHGHRSVTGLLGMGLLAGLPAVAGVWIGGQVNSQFSQVLFLAIGAGAVLVGLYDAIQHIRQTNIRQPIPASVFAGFLAGVVGLYIASILIA